jgi:hypothetical protein
VNCLRCRKISTFADYRESCRPLKGLQHRGTFCHSISVPLSRFHVIMAPTGPQQCHCSTTKPCRLPNHFTYGFPFHLLGLLDSRNNLGWEQIILDSIPLAGILSIFPAQSVCCSSGSLASMVCCCNVKVSKG